MKTLIIALILFTFLIVGLKYKKDKDLKKLLITLASFGFLISMAVVGNLTRPVVPIYIAHIILIVIAWGSLFMYVFKNRYYWWLVMSPVFTIGIFLALEYVGGSAHGVL